MKKIRKKCINWRIQKEEVSVFYPQGYLNVTLTGKVGMQPILPIKKINGVTHQQYNDSGGVLRYEQTLTISPRRKID